MASIPISAMTPASEMQLADVFPIVHAGANYKCTRPTFLTAIPGETIELLSSSASVQLDAAGNILMSASGTFNVAMGSGAFVSMSTDSMLLQLTSDGFSVGGNNMLLTLADNTTGLSLSMSSGGCEIAAPAGQSIDLKHATHKVVVVDSNGRLNLEPAPGQDLFCSANGAELILSSAGSVSLTCGDGNSAFIEYDETNPASWAGGPPGDLATAVERIAAFIASLLGPIP